MLELQNISYTKRPCGQGRRNGGPEGSEGPEGPLHPSFGKLCKSAPSKSKNAPSKYII